MRAGVATGRRVGVDARAVTDAGGGRRPRAPSTRPVARPGSASARGGAQDRGLVARRPSSWSGRAERGVDREVDARRRTARSRCRARRRPGSRRTRAARRRRAHRAGWPAPLASMTYGDPPVGVGPAPGEHVGAAARRRRDRPSTRPGRRPATRRRSASVRQLHASAAAPGAVRAPRSGATARPAASSPASARRRRSSASAEPGRLSARQLGRGAAAARARRAAGRSGWRRGGRRRARSRRARPGRPSVSSRDSLPRRDAGHRPGAGGDAELAGVARPGRRTRSRPKALPVQVGAVGEQRQPLLGHPGRARSRAAGRARRACCRSSPPVLCCSGPGSGRRRGTGAALVGAAGAIDVVRAARSRTRSRRPATGATSGSLGDRHPDAVPGPPVQAVQPSSTSSEGVGTLGGRTEDADVLADGWSSMVSCGDQRRLGVRAEDQLRRGDVDDRPQHRGRVALLEDDVGRAGLLGDDQARLVPVVGVARGEDAGDGGTGHEQHGEREPADDGAAGPGGLDLAAAGSAGDERRDQPAPAERVGLDEVLLGGHRPSAPDRGEDADGDAPAAAAAPAARRSRRRRRAGRGVPTGSRAAASPRAARRRVAASTTAAVGRQSGCSQSIDDRHRGEPEDAGDQADQDLGAGAVLPGAQHDDQAARARRAAVPARPSETASGAIRTSSRPTVAETATRISWATRASAPTRAGSISAGSAVMSAIE